MVDKVLTGRLVIVLISVSMVVLAVMSVLFISSGSHC